MVCANLDAKSCMAIACRAFCSTRGTGVFALQSLSENGALPHRVKPGGVGCAIPGVSPDECLVRQAGAGDVPQLTALIAESMNPDEGLQAKRTFDFHFSCKSAHIDDGRTYWILELKDEVIGIAGLHHYAWGPAENVWLAWFAVAPELQRKGFGTRLLNRVQEAAHNKGYRKLFIETYSSAEFHAARSFYLANGFTDVGRIASYLPSGEDMVVFGRTLYPMHDENPS